ncbi:expressed protein [Aureococcus anophagefferens]|uniref:Expressed protein n=1 Tax=Aureococcus anophagefferens TaxID=44056 RepID=F0YPK9_AURAN|nr:expressed protein [Aureococcus anophagefferens]EGB02948.1 expressed protein [Aureococcus anophagefferens]|eukprot:XP_009042351.1 expressed protein [Aureococcus anophagefferens]
MILDCIEMGPPSSPVPAPPPASADAAAVRAYATTLKDLGNDRFAAGDDDSASALYGKALDACHGSMGDLRCAALCNRAACHLRAKRWRACVADCDAALALDGARAKALYRRARAAEGLGDLAAAARDYKAFLVLEPRHKDATERARKVRFRFAMRRRDAAPPPAPAPGDLAEDFDAFSVRVRLAVSSLEDVDVALVGPSGPAPNPNLQSDCSVRVSGRASAGWFEPDGDYAPPFHAAGARPLEAGAHRLVVSRRGEELAAAAFDVWLYSRAALQHKALLRVRAPPPVLAALRTFVGDAAPLEPGTYPRDLFKSPQDPTPADAFPTLEAFARAMPPDSRRCVHAGAEISLRCCEGFRDGEARAFSVAEFLSRGRCGGVATALQTVAIDHHVAFKVDGVQVGLGSRPPPRWPPPGGGDDSD